MELSYSTTRKNMSLLVSLRWIGIRLRVVGILRWARSSCASIVVVPLFCLCAVAPRPGTGVPLAEGLLDPSIC